MRLKKEFINSIGKSFQKTKGQFGFSYIELLFSSFLLIIIIIGLLYTYIACFELNEFSRNLTLANNALQAQLELIRELPFNKLNDTWLRDNNYTPFTLDGFVAGEATGVIDVYVPKSHYTGEYYSDLKYIRVVACWRQKSGRVVGEDSDLDGTCQPEENLNPMNYDPDGNPVLDSPAEIITLISWIEI